MWSQSGIVFQWLKNNNIATRLENESCPFFKFLDMHNVWCSGTCCRLFLSTYKKSKGSETNWKNIGAIWNEKWNKGSVVFGNRKVAGSSSTVDNWCVVLYLHCLSSTSCNGYRLTMGDGLTCDGLVSNSGRVNDSEKDFKGLKNQR